MVNVARNDTTASNLTIRLRNNFLGISPDELEASVLLAIFLKVKEEAENLKSCLNKRWLELGNYNEVI